MRSRWLMLAALVALVFPGPVSGTSVPTAAPDIIVVMIDDMGYIDDDRVLSRLPNIRAVFLEGGRRFTQMYGETPLCCPGRANFLTGQHTLHHGVVKNDGDLLDPSTTIARVLDDAGYHTILTGKYLNRYSGDRTPVGWDSVAIMGLSDPTRFWVDGTLQSFGDQFKQDVVRQIAVDRLTAAPVDRPAFVWATPTAPHHCRQLSNPEVDCTFPLVMEPDQGAAECAGIPDYKPPNYSLDHDPRKYAQPMPDWPDGWQLVPVCESLLVVDRMVGQLVEAQRTRGRPAYLFLTVDNGMAWGQKGFPGKTVPPSTRLLFYAVGPGIPSGTYDGLVSNIDTAPTIAQIAGVAMPSADGVSFLPALTGEATGGRPSMLEIQGSRWAAIRTPTWHYIRWGFGERELYDLTSDPWELHDLVGERPGKVAELDRRLDVRLKASRG